MNIGIVELINIFIIGTICILIPAAMVAAVILFNNRLDKLETRITVLESREQE